MPVTRRPSAPPPSAGGVSENTAGFIVTEHSLPFKIVAEVQPDGSTHYSIKVTNAQGQEVVIHTADL